LPSASQFIIVMRWLILRCISRQLIRHTYHASRPMLPGQPDGQSFAHSSGGVPSAQPSGKIWYGHEPVLGGVNGVWYGKPVPTLGTPSWLPVFSVRAVAAPPALP
jgi:hypothetical protein